MSRQFVGYDPSESFWPEDDFLGGDSTLFPVPAEMMNSGDQPFIEVDFQELQGIGYDEAGPDYERSFEISDTLNRFEAGDHAVSRASRCRPGPARGLGAAARLGDQ